MQAKFTFKYLYNFLTKIQQIYTKGPKFALENLISFFFMRV
jgi:hypothetical protein